MNQKEFNELDQCIEILIAGGSIQDCIDKFPTVSSEVLAMIGMASETIARGDITIPAVAMENNLSRVLARANDFRDVNNNLDYAHPSWLVKLRRIFSTLPAMRPMAGRLIVVLAITALLIMFSGGLVITSAKSIPGDSLYPVKRVVEDIQYYLSTNSQSKLTVEEDFNQERVGEIMKLIALGRVQKISFEGVLEDQNNNLWKVSGIPIHILADTVFVDGLTGKQEITPGALVEVEGSTNADGTINASEIHLRQYQFEGTVEKIASNAWQISNYKIPVTSATKIESGIMVGDNVLVLIRSHDEGFSALSILSNGSGTPLPADRQPQITPHTHEQDAPDLDPTENHDPMEDSTPDPTESHESHDSEQSLAPEEQTTDESHSTATATQSTGEAEHSNWSETPTLHETPNPLEPHE